MEDIIFIGLVLFAIGWNFVFLWFIFTGKLEIEYGFGLCAITAGIPIAYFDLKMKK